MTRLRRYHAAVWDEPLVMEMGRPGGRGVVVPPLEPELASANGDPDELVPAALRRSAPPALPEVSEPEVLHHYLHLSQETLGMLGVSLFGTCTMKYNARLNEALAARPELAEVHPLQDEETLQGTLEMMVLKTLYLEPLHGWGIAQRIQQVSNDALKVGEGSLYPALQRLLLNEFVSAEWAVTENNRRARYYRITPAGRKQLLEEKRSFDFLLAGIARVMES